jgi:hypothetical protein
VYEFNGCYWHGCPRCQPLRDVPTIAEDTIAQRYERTMDRLQRITQAGYKVEVQWECDFDRDILQKHPELETLPIVEQSPLGTRDALYGGRTEAIRVHYKITDGETIQYMDVMSLYPWVCKYFKFRVGCPLIRGGRRRPYPLRRCRIVPHPTAVPFPNSRYTRLDNFRKYVASYIAISLLHCGITRRLVNTTSFPSCHRSRMFSTVLEQDAVSPSLSLRASFSLKLCSSVASRCANRGVRRRDVTSANHQPPGRNRSANRGAPCHVTSTDHDAPRRHVTAGQS